MRLEKRFGIYASLKDQAHEGWVHLLEPGLGPRSIVKITNPAAGRHVYCEALQIDKNFERQYAESSHTSTLEKSTALVVGRWYREKLGGIETGSQEKLIIRVRDDMWGSFRACVDHPQICIRLATRLAVISVALGITSLALGLFSLRLCIAGAIAGIFGLILLGAAVFWRREWR